MIRLILLLAVILIIFSLITVLLNKMFKSRKFIKYVPPVILFFLGVYNIYLARTGTGGFEDIGRAILAMMAFTGFLSGLVTGFILDFALNKKR